MPDAATTPPRTGTQAIERALGLLEVLDVLEDSPADAVTLTELATKTGLSPSTAHRACPRRRRPAAAGPAD